VPAFFTALNAILVHQGFGVVENLLRRLEADSMLAAVARILGLIPLEYWQRMLLQFRQYEYVLT